MTRNIRIRRADIYALLMGISFMTFIPGIGTVYFAIAVCIVMLIPLLGYRITRRNYSKLNISTQLVYWIIIIFQLYNLYTNWKNSGDTLWNVVCIKTIAAMFFTKRCYISNSQKSIITFLNVCQIWVIISFFDVLYRTLILGDTELVLLAGGRNGLGVFLLPILILDLYFLTKGIEKKLLTASLAMITIQLFLVWSATAIVGCVLILIFSVLEIRYNVTKKIFNPIIFYAIDWLIYIYIIVLRIYDNALTRWLVVDVLHRNLTFTGRTGVWDAAMILIARNPIYGSGVHAEYQTSVLWGVPAAHNYRLDILMQSGIIGLILFTTILLVIIFTKNIRASKGPRFLLLNTLLLLIIMNFESYCGYYAFPLVFMLLSLCAFSQNDKYEYYNVPVNLDRK